MGTAVTVADVSRYAAVLSDASAGKRTPGKRVLATAFDTVHQARFRNDSGDIERCRLHYSLSPLLNSKHSPLQLAS